LDPTHQPSFVTVARLLSFTRASEHLGIRQSTVSQHIRKLEAAIGRTLLVRDTHSVALTPDGETMLNFAGTILDTSDRAIAYFEGPRVRGRLRFGVSEDLVLSQLPQVLRDFRRSHPLVDLELSVELSDLLYRRLRAGALGERGCGQRHDKASRGKTHDHESPSSGDAWGVKQVIVSGAARERKQSCMV